MHGWSVLSLDAVECNSDLAWASSSLGHQRQSHACTAKARVAQKKCWKLSKQGYPFTNLRIVKLMHMLSNITQCWRNVDPLFSFLVSWRQSERKKRVGKKRPTVPVWQGKRSKAALAMPVWMDQFSKKNFPTLSFKDFPNSLTAMQRVFKVQWQESDESVVIVWPPFTK